MWPFSRKSKAPTTSVPVLQHPQAPVHTQPAPTQVVPVARQQAVAKENPSSQLVDVKVENIKSVIAAGECFDGNMRFQNGAKIDGRIKGNVEFGITDGMLVLNRSGVIEGDILGPRAIIVGEVIGNIMTTGKLIILPNAVIHGDIAAGTLQIHEGASINGRIQTVSEFEKQRTLEHDRQLNDAQDAVPARHLPERQAEVLRFATSN